MPFFGSISKRLRLSGWVQTSIHQWLTFRAEPSTNGSPLIHQRLTFRAEPSTNGSPLIHQWLTFRSLDALQVVDLYGFFRTAKILNARALNCIYSIKNSTASARARPRVCAHTRVSAWPLDARLRSRIPGALPPGPAALTPPLAPAGAFHSQGFAPHPSHASRGAPARKKKPPLPLGQQLAASPKRIRIEDLFSTYQPIVRTEKSIKPALWCKSSHTHPLPGQQNLFSFTFLLGPRCARSCAKTASWLIVERLAALFSVLWRRLRSLRSLRLPGIREHRLRLLRNASPRWLADCRCAAGW